MHDDELDENDPLTIKSNEVDWDRWLNGDTNSEEYQNLLKEICNYMSMYQNGNPWSSISAYTILGPGSSGYSSRRVVDPMAEITKKGSLYFNDKSTILEHLKPYDKTFNFYREDILVKVYHPLHALILKAQDRSISADYANPSDFIMDHRFFGQDELHRFLHQNGATKEQQCHILSLFLRSMLTVEIHNTKKNNCFILKGSKFIEEILGQVMDMMNGKIIPGESSSTMEDTPADFGSCNPTGTMQTVTLSSGVRNETLIEGLSKDAWKCPSIIRTQPVDNVPIELGSELCSTTFAVDSNSDLIVHCMYHNHPTTRASVSLGNWENFERLSRQILDSITCFELTALSEPMTS